MSQTMEITQEALETIGRYVQQNLASWLQGRTGIAYTERDLELRERAVRVEEELKAQRDLMNQGFENLRQLMAGQFEQVDKRFELVDRRFEQVDKRFELVDRRFDQVDKRFEQVDKRISDLNQHMNRWLTVITVMLGLIGIAITFGSFFR